MTETNLTRAYRVAFQAPDANPVSGHHLVVFKKIGAGQVLRQVLAPGELPRRKWFERPETLLAYAVSDNPHLRHEFSRSFAHREQEHAYILHFALAYGVGDPRRLAEQIESDPLRRLEDETAKLFGTAIRHLPWPVIAREADHLESDALHGERTDLAGRVRSNLESLQIFAETLGLALADVAISRTLPESAIAGAVKQETVAQELIGRQAEHTLAVQERHHDRELANLDAAAREALRVRGSLADAVSEVIRRLSSEIRSVADVENVLPRLESILDSVRRLPSRGAAASASGEREIAGSTTPLLTAASNDSHLGDLVGAASILRDGRGGNRLARRRLGAAILHLLAEVSLREEGSEESLAAESARIQVYFKTLLPALSDPEVDFLNRVQDLAALRARVEEDDGDE